MSTTADCDIVAGLGQAIAKRIGEPRYNFWFDQNTVFSWDEAVLEVGVPNHFFQEWLQKRFEPAVQEAAAEVLGGPRRVRFAIDPRLFRAARQAQETLKEHQRKQTPLKPASPEPDLACGRPAEKRRPPQAPSDKPAHARRWHRLADFVVGPCNRLAHAAVVSLLEAPGEGPNPLVLYGSVGTGKTHLLESAYAALRQANPGWRVCYVGAEEFTSRFVQAMRLGKLGAFRRQFRECDALLVDDLHFLASKRATQEEFLHTFDALEAHGRPVVVSCDCHPRVGSDLSRELVDRLLAGGAWPLQPPDLATRLDLLHFMALRERLSISEEALQLVAEQLRGNVRELEGCLHSLRHYSRVTGRAGDVGLAREVVAEQVRHSVRVLRLENVDQALCRGLGLEPGALQARLRTWAVSHPRMLAMYLARKHTQAAYSEIGRHFGGRNHSTAVAAEKKVRQWLERNEEMLLPGRRLNVRLAVELVERVLLS